MNTMRLALLALGSAAFIAGCGDGGGQARNNSQGFTSVVSFGDSLSDVGSYAVGTVALVGGGQYTINNSTGAKAKNWTTLVAGQYGLAAPCAAQTGLDGAAAQGFSVPVKNNAGCTNYAQGGARVTGAVGPGNKLLGGANAILGQLTVPVVTQIANHLAASGGSFKATDLVTVLAGGNDLFYQSGAITPTITALVTAGQTPAAAQATAVTTAVTEMAKAGAELAAYVNTQILAKGAKYVVVVNLPSVSKTPYALTQDVATQGLIDTMANTFNSALKAGLAGKAGVVMVDAYSESNNQAATPSVYGLTNVKDTACSKTSPANPLGGQSLTCTEKSLVAGDTSRYQYADDVHPTPYGYELLAKFVLINLGGAGWL
jgi:outer membrane lipase/esterase